MLGASRQRLSVFFLHAFLPSLSASDFQSEVGEVFGEIGGELPAKFGRRFSSFFCWRKSSEAFSTKTPPQISPSNFTTRFWVVAGPTSSFCQQMLLGIWPLLWEIASVLDLQVLARLLALAPSRRNVTFTSVGALACGARPCPRSARPGQLPHMLSGRKCEGRLSMGSCKNTLRRSVLRRVLEGVAAEVSSKGS